MTGFGQLMGQMPCDINLTRLIIAGYTLGVPNEAIAIAAILSEDRDLFMTQTQFKVHRSKMVKRKVSFKCKSEQTHI